LNILEFQTFPSLLLWYLACKFSHFCYHFYFFSSIRTSIELIRLPNFAISFILILGFSICALIIILALSFNFVQLNLKLHTCMIFWSTIN
jgi:hypothetical protein